MSTTTHNRVGRRSYGQEPPTAKQVDYYRSLCTSTGEQFNADDLLDRDSISKAIDRLKLKLAASGLAPARRANRYPGPCTKCGTTVPAACGWLGKVNGRYTVEHKDGECVARPAPVAPQPVASVDAPLGIHRIGDDYFRVLTSRRFAGRRVAQKLHIRDNGSGSFKYERGAVFRCTEDTLLSYEDACEFGLKHSFCVCCGTHLDDAISVVRGIGPVCEQGQWSHVAPPRTAEARRQAVEFLASGATPYTAADIAADIDTVVETALAKLDAVGDAIANSDDEPAPKKARARRIARPVITDDES